MDMTPVPDRPHRIIATMCRTKIALVDEVRRFSEHKCFGLPFVLNVADGATYDDLYGEVLLQLQFVYWIASLGT